MTEGHAFSKKNGRRSPFLCRWDNATARKTSVLSARSPPLEFRRSASSAWVTAVLWSHA